MQQLVRGTAAAEGAWERLNGPLPVTTPRTIVWPNRKQGSAGQ
jgi:hypothetical protein